MRLFALLMSLWLILPPAAVAAPTCLDRNGDTIRCGAEGAMPVGWKLTPAQLLEKEATQSTDPNWTNLAKAFCIVGILLAAIALLPEFDGARGADWDRQEGDSDPRK